MLIVKKFKKWYIRKLSNHLIKLSESENGFYEYQWFFHKLHFVGITGMNYGNSIPEENGEYFLIHHIAEKLKRRGSIIFDVGANIGDYTKKVYSEFDDSKIYCFEPSKETFKLLKINTINLGNIVYENMGLGEAIKEMILYKNSDNSALASVYHRNIEHFGVKLDEKEKIQITTLDDYCSINNIERIDFLKLDIEGNELNAFLGAQKMLSEKRIKFIQFEMGGCNIDSKTFWQQIYYYLKPNYKVYRILKNGIVEFEKYNEYQEIFVHSNYFAEAR